MFPRHFSPKLQILSGFVVTARNVTVSRRQNIPPVVFPATGAENTTNKAEDRGQLKLDTESFGAAVAKLGSRDPTRVTDGVQRVSLRQLATNSRRLRRRGETNGLQSTTPLNPTRWTFNVMYSCQKMCQEKFDQLNFSHIYQSRVHSVTVSLTCDWYFSLLGFSRSFKLCQGEWKRSACSSSTDTVNSIHRP